MKKKPSKSELSKLDNVFTNIDWKVINSLQDILVVLMGRMNLYAYDMVVLTKDELVGLKVVGELKNVLEKKAKLAVEGIINRLENYEIIKDGKIKFGEKKWIKG